MSGAHALLGLLALVLALIAGAWSVGLVVLRRPPGTLFLGSLVWLVAVIGVTAVLGAATAVSSAPPRDPLHLVYGILAVGVLPGATLVASGRTGRGQTVVAAIACVVLVILLLRLLQTGA